jgi:hypothetical protein
MKYIVVKIMAHTAMRLYVTRGLEWQGAVSLMGIMGHFFYANGLNRLLKQGMRFGGQG